MAEKTATRDSAVENGDGSFSSTTKTRQTKGQKAKAHCGRFWWIYLIALVIVVLVVVLPIIFVAYPKLAREGVANSELVPTREAFLNPAPDSFDLELDTILLSDSKFHPTLDPFNGSLYLDGSESPFAYINVPEIKAKNGTVAHVAQRVQVADQMQFQNYCITALSSETYTLRLKGKGSLKQGSLQSVSVNYDQPVESKGLNGFKGLAITSFFLQSSGLPAGFNANGTVLVPNPSVLTLAVGDASFKISVDGTAIANATIPDLTLTPGNNTYPINVQSDIMAVTGILSDPRFQCGMLPVDIIGVESIYDGKLLPYFTAALKQNSVRTMLDIVPALEKQGLGELVQGKECVAS
ncbi:uncharacterized protein RCC_04334 [Ramularia collo-cygni]|uniref:Uncharacterized protein n=1 Tax=Ramularia collo-cygni TaxID=112498 RepID=A0A2D3VAC7_9PEZI|nr:uncharacterized protein RCC_04334 [Ramularia collo-cygni]CZT18489.1 uncharacterized protein RCC_04334 [Ramularia collo-cygni]